MVMPAPARALKAESQVPEFPGYAVVFPGIRALGPGILAPPRCAWNNSFQPKFFSAPYAREREPPCN